VTLTAISSRDPPRRPHKLPENRGHHRTTVASGRRESEWLTVVRKRGLKNGGCSIDCDMAGQLREGDQQAAQRLWQRYYEQLVRIARGKLRAVPVARRMKKMSC